MLLRGVYLSFLAYSMIVLNMEQWLCDEKDVEKQIGSAVEEALPRAEVQRLADENKFSPRGTLIFETPEELRMIVETTRMMYPRFFGHLSDTDVVELVAHEEEHIAAARRNYGKREIPADFKYGIRFARDGDEIGFMLIYYIQALLDIPDDLKRETAEAPRHLSPADLAQIRKFGSLATDTGDQDND